jgi:uncharacterized protein
MAISTDVVAQTAMRIAEHVKTHDLGSVEVVLHGGEPLLAGVAGLRRILAELARTVGGLCRLDLRVHTNGVLLSEEFCGLFDEYDVQVGISLDGDRVANDRHRRYRDGRSSFDQAVRAIRLLASDRFRHLYAGLLATIDVANDPVAVYESLLELSPARLDFLLPHATWESPPARTDPSGAEYADWLIAIFDRWQADGRPVGIRTFDSIIAMLAGGQSSTEALGLAPVRMVVIETDGTYEQADSLKVAYEGAPATGLDVFGHSVDAVTDHPGLAARRRGLEGLCDTCRQCPVVSTCGGGMYAHRYRSDSEFDNPSVYCRDLLKLIEHVKAALPPAAAARRNPNHAISGSVLDQLAAGLGGAEAIGQLTQAQRSMRRALLTAVYEAGTGASAVPAAVKDRMRTAWQVLAIADGDRRGVLDSVLGHPHLRGWGDRCLDRLRSSGRPDGCAADGYGAAGLVADLDHLGAVAAAVAIRGRATAQVTVPVIDGAVHLPGLGRLSIGSAKGVAPGTGVERAFLETDADWLGVRVGDEALRLPRARLVAHEPCQAEHCAPDGARAKTVGGPSAAWEPVRVLTAPGIRVGFEDTDPHRGGHGPAAPRLTDEEFARWQRDFSLAWQQIQSNHPAYGPALAAGLTVLTPMPAGAAARVVGPAARHAFGAIETALTAAPTTLALALIREFQHAKLAGVLELLDLVGPADAGPNRAPTRAGSGPLYRLLHSAYASLAVTEFWRARAELGESDHAEARQQYERWRAHTVDAIDTLTGSNSLTSLGARFVDGMRAAISKATRSALAKPTRQIPSGSGIGIVRSAALRVARAALWHRQRNFATVDRGRHRHRYARRRPGRTVHAHWRTTRPGRGEPGRSSVLLPQLRSNTQA